jgi:hypothetical protein
LATDLLGIIHIDISSHKKAHAQIELQNWAQKLSQDIIKEPKSPRLWKNRHELLPSLSRRIELAKKSIFLVGFSLKSTLDHHRNVLVDTLNDNLKLKVKMLMVHPDSLHVPAHEPFADRIVSKEIPEVLGQLESLYNDLNGSAKKRIDARLTDYLPRFAVKAFDNETMLINLYIYKSRAQENPVFEINKTSNTGA